MADGDASVRITVLNGSACLRVKSWQPEAAGSVASGASAAPLTLAGRELPTEVGATLDGPIRVLSVGPGEWLIQSRQRPASELRQGVESLLPAQGYSLVDLSDGLATLEVQGTAARELLSKGCGLDLHPQRFALGRCARTRFAGIPVVLECLDGPPRFELTVARSYSQYLHGWLDDAAVEFGTSLK